MSFQGFIAALMETFINNIVDANQVRDIIKALKVLVIN